MLVKPPLISTAIQPALQDTVCKLNIKLFYKLSLDLGVKQQPPSLHVPDQAVHEEILHDSNED